MLDVVEGVIHEEAQLRNDAQLEAQTLPKLVSHALDVAVDVVDDLLAFFRGEHAQVDAAHTHVGADAYGADRNEQPVCRLGLEEEHFAQFFLNQSGYFLLSCCFHIG